MVLELPIQVCAIPCDTSPLEGRLPLSCVGAAGNCLVETLQPEDPEPEASPRTM